MLDEERVVREVEATGWGGGMRRWIQPDDAVPIGESEQTIVAAIGDEQRVSVVGRSRAGLTGEPEPRIRLEHLHGPRKGAGCGLATDNPCPLPDDGDSGV